jgi:hypothetical protein
MKNKISNWMDIVGIQPIEAYVAKRFGDKTKFRISKRTYDGGEKNTGGMVSSMCFVLHGKCRYSFGELKFDLKGGEYCELPEGKYSFEVLDESGCENILVMKIPAS